jgi:5-methylcytosine-specific restriction endonuclease McrA
MTEEERKARRAQQERQRRAANPEKHQEAKRQWRVQNREKELEQQRQRRAANPAKYQESKRQWRAANPESDQLYRESNRETKLESQRRYREANREKLLEKQRQYNQNNKEKRLQYNEANREAAIERTKEWRNANPERARENSLQSVNNRRARKQGALDPCAPVTASATRQRVWLFCNTCAYCGDDGPLHLDHVEPLARGGRHAPDNLVPACHRCNWSKNARPVETWYLSQPFFSAERWEVLQAHTGRQWSAAEQLSLMGLLEA